MGKFVRRLAFAGLALAALAGPAAAQTKLRIMVGGIDKQIYLPAKLAEQIGAFKEEGLDVELFNSTSGSQAATALLAREVQAFKVGINKPRSRGDRAEPFGGRGASWLGCFVGGELLVQAVTQGPADELLYGNFPEHSRYPAAI